MMRVVLSTPVLSDRLRAWARPFNFLFCPLIDPLAGYPLGVDPGQFTLIAPFTKDGARWWRLACINVHDGRRFALSLRQTERLDRAVVQTLGSVLRRYLGHPEAKSLAPDGAACSASTRGLLKRMAIVAARLRFVGKETDRHWEQGEDLSLLGHRVVEYEPKGRLVVADPATRARIRAAGLRQLRRQGFGQHTLEAIVQGRRVRAGTLRRVGEAVQQEPGRPKVATTARPTFLTDSLREDRRKPRQRANNARIAGP